MSESRYHTAGEVIGTYVASRWPKLNLSVELREVVANWDSTWSRFSSTISQSKGEIIDKSRNSTNFYPEVIFLYNISNVPSEDFNMAVVCGEVRDRLIPMSVELGLTVDTKCPSSFLITREMKPNIPNPILPLITADKKFRDHFWDLDQDGWYGWSGTQPVQLHMMRDVKLEIIPSDSETMMSIAFIPSFYVGWKKHKDEDGKKFHMLKFRFKAQESLHIVNKCSKYLKLVNWTGSCDSDSPNNILAKWWVKDPVESVRRLDRRTEQKDLEYVIRDSVEIEIGFTETEALMRVGIGSLSSVEAEAVFKTLWEHELAPLLYQKGINYMVMLKRTDDPEWALIKKVDDVSKRPINI